MNEEEKKEEKSGNGKETEDQYRLNTRIPDGEKPVQKTTGSQNIIARSVAYSALLVVVILLIAGGVVYAYRSAIFSHFASEYIQKNSEQMTGNGISGGAVLSQQTRVVNVVAKSVPSVVSVIVSKEVPVYERNFQANPFGFFDSPTLQQKGTQTQEVGGGSGFIVSSDGLIVTNRHVVSDENASYTVITNDGKTYNAKVVARDPFIDLAMLKIDGSNFTPLDFGDSSKLQLGQTVIAIGNALGEFQNTVSVGVVSGLSRSIVASGDSGSEALSQVIQTDAALNPGNSGGPLFDLSGKVIGINVAIAQGTQNIAFSIPSNFVKSIVESVEKTGKIVQPYLGVRYVPVTPDLVKANSLSVDHGALILPGQNNELAVIPGSPADKAGLKENDIILSVDGEDVTQSNPLGVLIREQAVGTTVTLDVLHAGKHETVKVTLEKAPDDLGT
ncbi:MAG TPA: trypsin-like peptidase domain-containing protein [Candidatus Paceibacterota bacterium]|nr:trypsin-like peptidase domain-containing protein [Candidatus Paceibacterota bacterium]